MREPIADRPGFPSGYGIDREHRADMLAWDSARQRLIDARNYWLSTTRPDGRPHVAPVWGLWMDEAFYFSTDPQSRKGRNLAAQPDINVHLESGDDVVMIEGKAERVIATPELEKMADLYDQKYGIRFDPTDPSFGVYAVRPLLAFGWTEQSFPTTATRWRFTTPD